MQYNLQARQIYFASNYILQKPAYHCTDVEQTSSKINSRWIIDVIVKRSRPVRKMIVIYFVREHSI